MSKSFLLLHIICNLTVLPDQPMKVRTSSVV